MPEHPPCVSVVIPVYNSGPYLEPAVTSALDQPETLEVLLVEDASTDDSLVRCRKLNAAQQRVRLFQHMDRGNHGAAASRNLGIRASRGAYIAFLDADDCYLPGRFNRGIELLTSRPRLDGVYEAYRIRHDVGADPDDRFNLGLGGRNIVIGRRICTDHRQFFRHFVFNRIDQFHTNSILLRREVFGRVGLFDEHLRLGQDTALWFRICAVCRLAPGDIARPKSEYRRHGGNRWVTGKPGSEDYGLGIAHTVHRWLMRRRATASRLLIMREYYLLECLMWRGVPISRLGHRLVQIKRLLTICGQEPWVMCNTFFLKVLGVKLGWRDEVL